MDKTIFISGLSFFILEALVFLGYLVSQVKVNEEIVGIGVFGLLNIVFAVLMLVGVLKEDG